MGVENHDPCHLPSRRGFQLPGPALPSSPLLPLPFLCLRELWRKVDPHPPHHHTPSPPTLLFQWPSAISCWALPSDSHTLSHSYTSCIPPTPPPTAPTSPPPTTPTPGYGVPTAPQEASVCPSLPCLGCSYTIEKLVSIFSSLDAEFTEAPDRGPGPPPNQPAAAGGTG